MQKVRTMEKLKLWALYIKPHNSSQWFFVTREYWEVKIDALIKVNRLIDNRSGIKNNYKKVLEELDGSLADEKDFKFFE